MKIDIVVGIYVSFVCSKRHFSIMWSGKFNLKEKSSRKEKRKVAHKEKKGRGITKTCYTGKTESIS